MKKAQKPAKKSAPTKKAPPAKKAMPAKKAAPIKKAAPVKAKSAVKSAPAKNVKGKEKSKATKVEPKKTPAKVPNKPAKIEAKKVATKIPPKPSKPLKVEAKKVIFQKTVVHKQVPVEKPVKKVEVKPAKVPPVIETKKTAVSAKKEEKKLSKKDEKELLKKGKGKKADTFEDQILEELEAKSREDEDDFDDFEGNVPEQKVKMTFDEDLEVEVVPVRKKKVGIDEDIKENLAEEILALSEDFKIEDIFSSIRNMELFKVESDECVVRGCDNPSTTNGYCRFHYIKFWKDVKKKELILEEGRLAKIIEDLVRKYPLKYIETIIQDLADDKAFNHVLKDLDIETDAEDLDTFEDDELLDDDQDIAFETKVVKPSFDD